MNRKNVLHAAIAAALAPAVVGGYLTFTIPAIPEAHADPSPSAVASPLAVLPDFSGLVGQAGPAVIAISVAQMRHTGFDEFPPGLDKNDPFFDFFRRFQWPEPQDDERPVQGVGSGFLITPDGYILTNAHVVANAEEVHVKLTDRREFKAKVVGSDHKSDIALIKIDANNLPVLKIGDPNTLKVGAWVAAIGSPFGLENTVTAGIVSAKSRSLPDDNYVPFIQTDVPINPGNSGGPLLNMKGEVVGINSQIYSRSGGYMGLSFAIPIDVAMKIEDQLMHHGKVTRGRLGVTIQSLDQELGESFGLKKPEGALVSEVQKGSRAAKAGIRAGDVILSVNGRQIGESADLSRLIADMRPGETARLHLVRDGEGKDITVTIGEMSSERVADNDANGNLNSGRLGVVVRPLDPEEQHKLKETGSFLVEQASGAAARAGIRPGDVILAVTNRPVSDAVQLKKLIDQSGSQIAVLVKRDDMEIYVPVRLG
ncbi:MAG: DegQ family serine endoprotease [Gammaproteobacteria bacterium]